MASSVSAFLVEDSPADKLTAAPKIPSERGWR
jgi:hypothetical protein